MRKLTCPHTAFLSALDGGLAGLTRGPLLRATAGGSNQNSTCDLLDVCPGYEAREMVLWIVAVAWQEFLVVRVATTKLFWEPFGYQHMRYKHVTFAFDGARGDQKFLTKT